MRSKCGRTLVRPADDALELRLSIAILEQRAERGDVRLSPSLAREIAGWLKRLLPAA